MDKARPQLKSHVNLLGQYLGKTIQTNYGNAFLHKIEEIRHLAKAIRQGDSQEDQGALVALLNALKDDELLPVCRAFSQFLNLANVAEQHAATSDKQELEQHFAKIIDILQQTQLCTADIEKKLQSLDIELVLTAHPTEVIRRTFIDKHRQLNDCLEKLSRNNLDDFDKQSVLNRIEQLISQAWHTHEIRNQRPSPLDEAKSGYAVIEHSLWQAVPEFLRRFTHRLHQAFAIDLPHTFMPIRFASWIGGDRDGNPYVTAQVTEKVLKTGHWIALNLYEKDIITLINELSMSDCTEALTHVANGHHEPYRTILRQLRNDLRQSIHALEGSHETPCIQHIEQLRHPLLLCHESLQATGMKVIAEGLLLDILRRLSCFGLYLTQLDIRQHAHQHTQALSEITIALDLGDYGTWDEAKKQKFLCTELDSQRPLIPTNWQPSPQTQEVLATCTLIAKQECKQTLGLYIVSMCSQPSDILAARLLMKAAGCHTPLPVVPLFETLDDLQRASQVMQDLFSLVPPQHRQWVMIGYSDSAKDAGMIAASWAQYEAMEKLVDLAKTYQVRLTLFHGRGGSIGRGGGPAREAILSQPPGSLQGGLRVTEQGEMIRFKFGLPQIAQQSMALYLQATLEANLSPPPTPKMTWRHLMQQMATCACDHYRHFVQANSDFVRYFQCATPEQELSQLPLGSRPARRKKSQSIADLRAIPWIFAWSQTRLMLPVWLGAKVGLSLALKPENQAVFHEMRSQWPFFRTRLEMLEMVFLKADVSIAQHYHDNLVPEDLKYLGEKLHQELIDILSQWRQLSGHDTLLANQPWIRESIALRNPYIDPLNLLQTELLARARHHCRSYSAEIEQALMVTVAGIAAGLRNTG